MSGKRPPPAVSCVMIFFDGVRFLDEAIRSVVAQVGFDDWELLLVDDGSTDGSSTVAHAWAQADPLRIRSIEHPGHANRGMSASRNAGLQAAAGEYVTFLDSDDVWLPATLAHRMCVAAAHPTADVVVGGTWRWHSWSGIETDRRLDVPMPLPIAPAYTTLDPPRLLHAIYGVPGGGHVPAMCSLVIRRTALLELGGMVADFRDLYEDQVLYVKLGLHLRAVVDPRPLALYRQHPASACSVAIANGTWNPWQANEPGARFFEWMRDYVAREGGPNSDELAIVERNIDVIRRRASERPYAARALARRYAPRSVHELVHWLRTRRHRPPRPTVLQRWSEEFLDMAVATMDGDVVVVTPSVASAQPWTADVPGSAFRSAPRVVREPFDSLPAEPAFDHVVVPERSAREVTPDALLASIARVLRPGGSVAAVLPGPDRLAPPNALRRAELLALAQHRFPDGHVAVEAFGNTETVAAVAADELASEVHGVSIDDHDGRTEVALALLVRPCHPVPTSAADAS